MHTHSGHPGRLGQGVRSRRRGPRVKKMNGWGGGGGKLPPPLPALPFSEPIRQRRWAGGEARPAGRRAGPSVCVWGKGGGGTLPFRLVVVRCAFVRAKTPSPLDLERLRGKGRWGAARPRSLAWARRTARRTAAAARQGRAGQGRGRRRSRGRDERWVGPRNVKEGWLQHGMGFSTGFGPKRVERRGGEHAGWGGARGERKEGRERGGGTKPRTCG